MKLPLGAAFLLCIKPTSAKILAGGSVKKSSDSSINRRDSTTRNLNPEYSCFGDHDFAVFFKGRCDYDHLVERMDLKVKENARCVNSGAEEVQLLVGITDPRQEDIARERVKKICKTAMDDVANDPTKTVPWSQVTGYGKNFDKQYFDGNTHWNEERQTDYDSLIPGKPSNVLKRDGERIKDLYETVAERVPFQWPDYIDNFENCEIRAAMCCWVTDRQANDNNGNCATPYDEKCIDKDPADNTEICSVDMTRGASTGSSFIEDGLSVYRGDFEGATHCHGLAWGTDDMEPEARYKGNNLFYISMYDHLYTRGYSRNVPGAPMCGCVENMPVVTRSDCTEISAKEFWKFEWDAATKLLSASLDRAEIDFNACNGDGRNNDLEAYYRRLYREGRASWDDRQKLFRTITGNEKCHEGTEAMMWDKGYETYYPPTGLTSENGELYSIKIYGGTNAGKDYLYTSNGGDVQLISGYTDDKAKWRLIPLNEDKSLFNVRPKPNALGLESDETFLASDDRGNVQMSAFDNRKGNQQWYIQKIPGTENVYYFFIAGNTHTGETYLSTNSNGNPDLYHKDDASGRQRWVIELSEEKFVPEDPSIKNVAFGKPTNQVSTCHNGFSSRAVDGNTNGNWGGGSVTHTCRGTDNEWWEVYLLEEYDISEIEVFNRVDCCGSRLGGFQVIVFRDNQEVWSYQHPGGTPPYQNIIKIGEEDTVIGDRVRIQLNRREYLSLAEVIVKGKTPEVE